MISQVESFLYPGTPEEGRRIKWPKGCVSTYRRKDKDNSKKKKNHNQSICLFTTINWLIDCFIKKKTNLNNIILWKLTILYQTQS